MRHPKLLTLAVLAASTAGLGVLSPAAHAATDTTDVTFTLTAGALAIDAPLSADLGAAATSAALSSISGQLGTTTVTDGRASLLAAYQVTLTSSDFTTGTEGTDETIVGTTVTSFSGPVTHTNAGGVPVETTTDTISTLPIMSLTGHNGTDEATYDPTVTIPIPATNVAGVYSGVITQTVLAVV